MVYQAPILVVLIAGMVGMRSFCHWLERRDVNVPVYLNYYTWLFIIMLLLMIESFNAMYRDIMQVSGWLTAETTNTFVRGIMTSNHELEENFSVWQEEASLEGWDFLRLFSLTSPLWVIATYFTCLWHCIEFVKVVSRAKSEGWECERSDGSMGIVRGLCDMHRHDQTILILVLPHFYGLMAFKSVCRTWQVNIDHLGTSKVSLFNSFAERKDFLGQMYEANFMVGDVYETYALIVFGRLVLDVLKEGIRKKERAVSKKNRDSVTGLGGKPGDAPDDLHETVDELVESLQGLTVSGVQLFNWSCLAQALYTLVVTTCGLYNILPYYFSTHLENPGYFQHEEVKSMAKNFFLGTGLVASVAAINNIMSVEHSFEKFLEEFKPSPKFWGTKILVSLAFMQSIILKVVPPFSGWSETRINLFYSSVLCMECFFVTLLHINAWGVNESWYRNKPLKEEESREALLG